MATFSAEQWKDIRADILAKKLAEFEASAKVAEQFAAEAPNFAAWAEVDRACATAVRALAAPAQRSPLEVAREALRDIERGAKECGRCDRGEFGKIASRALRRMDAPAATPAAVPVETPPKSCLVSCEAGVLCHGRCVRARGHAGLCRCVEHGGAGIDAVIPSAPATPPTPAQPCATCNGTRIMRKFSGAVECPDCVATPAQPGACDVPSCTCDLGTVSDMWAHRRDCARYGWDEAQEDADPALTPAIPPREGMPGETTTEDMWRHGFVVHNEGGCGWRGPTARRFTNDRCGLAAKHPFHVATPPSSTPPGERR